MLVVSTLQNLLLEIGDTMKKPNIHVTDLVTTFALLVVWLLGASIAKAQPEQHTFIDDDPVATCSATQCNPDNSESRSIIENVLSNERWIGRIAKYGVIGLSTSDIQVLTGSEDACICERFRINHPAPKNNARLRWTQTFYKAGEFYFIVQWNEPIDPEIIDLVPGSVRILDNHLEPLVMYLL